MKQVIDAIQNNRLGIGAEILKGATGGTHFPGGAPEGTIHTYKNGKKYKKTAGEWKEVSSGKKGAGKEGAPTPTAAAPAGGKGGQVEPASKHDLAQLTHMKEIMEADPKKAYEIFQSLEPAAQHMVPQDVVNKMVKASHEDASKEGASFDDLGGKPDPEKEELEKKESAKKEPAKKDDGKMDVDKIKEAIKIFEDRIKKQGNVTNARDEQHLSSLKKVLNDLEGDAKKEAHDNAMAKHKKDVASTGKADPKTVKEVNDTSKELFNHRKAAEKKKSAAKYGKSQKTYEEMFGKNPVGHKHTTEEAKAALAESGHKSVTDGMISKKQRSLDAMNDMKPSEEQVKYFMDNKDAVVKIMEEDISMGIRDAVEQHQKDTPKDSPEAKFNAIFDKYDKKDYFGTNDLVKTQIGNWERAMGKGDEGAKQYTKEKVEEIVRGGQKALSKQSFDKMAEAIKKNDLPYLKSRLRYDQKFTKDIYESITGKKLPNSTKAIHAMLDGNNDLKKALEVAELHNQAEINMIIKGGKALPIGTKRVHGGVPVEKTAKGWVPEKKYSGKRQGEKTPEAAGVLAHTKDINKMKESRNRMKHGSTEHKNAQSKIDAMEGRFIKDKSGKNIGVKDKSPTVGVNIGSNLKGISLANKRDRQDSIINNLNSLKVGGVVALVDMTNGFSGAVKIVSKNGDTYTGYRVIDLATPNGTEEFKAKNNMQTFTRKNVTTFAARASHETQKSVVSYIGRFGKFDDLIKKP
jgi:hypothetical protein